MILNYKILLCLIIILASGTVKAHPVASKGTLSLMGETTEERQVFDTIYSAQYYWGLGMKSVFMDEGKSKSITPMTSFLIKRINGPHYQANVYAYGGVGHSWLEDQDSTNYLYGTQIDWETRRYYMLFKHEKLQTHDQDLMEEYQYRLGVAPFLASYNEVQPWLILQASQDTAISKRYDVAPIVRVFYKNVLGEVGRSTRGESIFNFMFHYYF